MATRFSATSTRSSPWIARTSRSLGYQVGKRNAENTDAFAHDLALPRVTGRPQISSDAWPADLPAIGRAFHGQAGADYGQII